MAKEDWKSIVITLVITTLILNFFVNTTKENKAFQISHNRIKYHANWTNSFQELQHVKQLQQAYLISGITEFDLSLSMSNLKFEDVKKLLPSSFKQYQSIKINVANNPIGTAGADYILSLIPNGVQELELEFDSIQADNSLGDILAKRLNNINSLKKLKLSLILTIKDHALLESYLRYSRLGENLKSYSLIVIGNSLPASSLGYLESHLARANLQALDLNLYANKIEAEGAKLVADSIKTQKNLNYLSLDLYFNNITEVGTEYICDAIDAIKSQKLQYINLNLDFNYIKNEGAKAVGKLLSKLEHVDSLHVGVASKNFGYLGFKHIVNGLSKLDQLRELTFRCGINRVGANGAEITRDLLYKLPKLTFLSINFYENYVGDDGLIELSKGIASLQHLSRLSVNFGFNDAKGFGLIRALQNLVKRTYLELFISFSSNQFQDTEVELIKDELSKLIRSTKRFQFQFMETAISKKMKTQLQQLFAKVAVTSGNKATIRVNSVITDQKQAEYQKKSEGRKEQLEEIGKKKDSQGEVDNKIQEESTPEEEDGSPDQPQTIKQPEQERISRSSAQTTQQL